MSAPARLRRPALLRQVPLDAHAVLEASAGTGKTFTLECLVVEILLSARATIDQILVVTFTERATAELRQRVRERLEKLLAAAPGSDEDPALPDADCWIVDEDARGRLRAALRAFDAATIATIHAFCKRVLAEHAFTHGRLLVEAQVDGREAFHRAFRAALRETLARDEGDRRYLAAALARPGASVDTVEQELFDVAMERGALVPGYDEATLVAATRALPPILDEPRLSAELKLVGVRANSIPKLAGILSAVGALAARFSVDEDPAALLGGLEAIEGGDVDKVRLDGLGYARALLDKAPRLAGSPLAPLPPALAALGAASPSFAASLAQRFLPSVRERLDRRKREAGEFDFDDMLVLLRDGLRGPRGAEACALLRERFRYALIDEFQDTDEVQWEIFRRAFFQPPTDEACARSILYVIGDPKQAIYSFRGGDVHTYVAATDAIAPPGTEGGERRRLVLGENFRSSRPLLDGVNAILDQSAGFFTSARIRYDRPVTCGDPARGALDGDGNPAVPIQLLPIAAHGHDDAKAAIAERIAVEARRLLDPRRPPLVVLDKHGRHRLEAKDIHVLTRTEREGELVGEALRAVGIAHAYYKQDGLFDRPEARHVFDLLAAIDDPGSSRKRLRAWLTPFFGLTLAAARGAGRGDGVDADHPLARRLADWSALAARKEHDALFASILEESGVVRRELFCGREGERALTNYQHLFELLVEESARTHATLGELVLALDGFIAGRQRPLAGSEEPGLQRLESERDAVQIMTMHKAKGLEAPVVFLVGGLKKRGTPPPVQPFHDAADRRCAWVGRRPPDDIAAAIARETEEEDQRLLYVALTRARVRLYLPYFPSPPPPSPTEKGRKKGARAASFSPDGAYRCVNDRLRALVERDGADPSIFALASAGAAPATTAAPSEAGDEAALADWTPPAILVEEAGRGASLRGLTAARRGVRVTSYTRLRQDASGRLAALRGDGALAAVEAREESMIEPLPATPEALVTLDERGAVDGDAVRAAAAPGAAPAVDGDALPGGVASGLFLHAVLERLDLGALVDGAGATVPLAAFRARPDVAALLAAEASAHRVEARHLPAAARLVHTALTSPVALDGLTLPGLHRADATVREMEFLYPLDPAAGRRVAAAAGGAAARVTVAAEGFVKGYVDFLFEARGRAWFADWKSDALPRWDAATVDAHVERHYLLQARLYSLALVRLLDARDEAAYEARFGGLVYCFLRGMRPDGGGGLYVRRPTWTEIVAWEEELRCLAEATR